MAYTEFTTEELEREEWRPVVGYEGVYSVSNLGRVKREKAAQGTRLGKIRKPRPDKDGYLTLNLWNGNKKAKTAKVHILVARAFLPPDATRPLVNHKDGVKSNARVSNLEWSTGPENREHARVTGLLATGERNGSRKHPETRPRGKDNGMHTHPESRQYGERGYFAKLTNAQAEEIRGRYQKNKKGLIKALAAEFGVNRVTIHRIGTGRIYNLPPTSRDE